MRIYAIEKDGTFREYIETPFDEAHRESVLERWLEQNPNSIIEDGSLLIIGRQIPTNLGTMIDLMALDREGETVVIELKRDRTPRKTLAQALEYASFAQILDADQLEDILRSYISDPSTNLAEYHRKYFKLSDDTAVAFNKDQRIVIVGQHVTDGIRQTAEFLRNKGLRVTCLEFSFFQTEAGKSVISSEVVVGRQHPQVSGVSSAAMPQITEEQFLASLDEHGTHVFTKILELARAESLPIHWGINGFSLNVDLDGAHIALCFCYRPTSVFGQSIYTVLFRRGGLVSKANVAEDVASELASRAQETGLFIPAGRELKCVIERRFSADEISSIISWIQELAATIRELASRDGRELSEWQKFCREKRLEGNDFKEIGRIWKARVNEET